MAERTVLIVSARTFKELTHLLRESGNGGKIHDSHGPMLDMTGIYLEPLGNDDPLDHPEFIAQVHASQARIDEPIDDVQKFADDLMRQAVSDTPAQRAIEVGQRIANQRQVGGDHYGGAALQHWDLAVMFRWDYLQGQIIKYVMRWRKKNGLQDLEKAKHNLEKYIEEIKDGRME